MDDPYDSMNAMKCRYGYLDAHSHGRAEFGLGLLRDWVKFIRNGPFQMGIFVWNSLAHIGIGPALTSNPSPPERRWPTNRERRRNTKENTKAKIERTSLRSTQPIPSKHTDRWHGIKFKIPPKPPNFISFAIEFQFNPELNISAFRHLNPPHNQSHLSLSLSLRVETLAPTLTLTLVRVHQTCESVDSDRFSTNFRVFLTIFTDPIVYFAGSPWKERNPSLSRRELMPSKFYCSPKNLFLVLAIRVKILLIMASQILDLKMMKTSLSLFVCLSIISTCICIYVYLCIHIFRVVCVWW